MEYTKAGKKKKGPNSGETEHRKRAEKRAAGVPNAPKEGFLTTAAKMAHIEEATRPR